VRHQLPLLIFFPGVDCDTKDEFVSANTSKPESEIAKKKKSVNLRKESSLGTYQFMEIQGKK
jgi:hypothetical protein